MDAYVLLNNDSYTTNQDIPVSDILKNMKARRMVQMLNCRRIMIRFSGQKVNGSIAVRMTRFWTIRWKFFMDGVITIRNAGHRTSCNLEFLVGTGKQLDDDATRYKVRVYLERKN